MLVEEKVGRLEVQHRRLLVMQRGQPPGDLHAVVQGLRQRQPLAALRLEHREQRCRLRRSLGDVSPDVLGSHEEHFVAPHLGGIGFEPSYVEAEDEVIVTAFNEAFGGEERSDGQVITIGGLVTGIQRKTTKQGSMWAIVTLEDLEGAIEVMVFPQSYQGAATLIAEDTVLFVRGRIDRPDEDSPRLVAMEITAPDLSEASVGPVRLTMAASRCTPPIVERLKAVLAEHPGVTEVHLNLSSEGRTTVMRLDDRLRVTPSPALYGDLKALLGAACLA